MRSCLSASSPYHQVYFYAFSRLPEPSRAGSEVIINLRGCQSSLCLTSPPTFLAPVEPRLLVAYLARPCFFFTHIQAFWCCSTHQGDYCPTYTGTMSLRSWLPSAFCTSWASHCNGVSIALMWCKSHLQALVHHPLPCLCLTALNTQEGIETW